MKEEGQENDSVTNYLKEVATDKHTEVPVGRKQRISQRDGHEAGPGYSDSEDGEGTTKTQECRQPQKLEKAERDFLV